MRVELDVEGPTDVAAERIAFLVDVALATAGVRGGHLAVSFVDAKAIAALNAEHRGKAGPTDVLSFPVDGAEPDVGPDERELGDVVICPEHTVDVEEAVVHGVLHLIGMDHEADAGEMLALQDQLMAWLR